jgi:ABC-type transporter Mla subunit MlaD
MRGRSPLQSLAASPTTVGAVTTLIVIVAVFLAYNANNGLPFVPVYRVSVEVPNAARLTQNNEVRIGGHRVGVVESIEVVQPSGAEATDPPSETEATDEEVIGGSSQNPDEVVARLNLKLDKSAEPLPVDSVFRIRYRSSFGLKYLDIERGIGEAAPEGHLFDDPNNFIEQTEFDDIANTFDSATRENSRINLIGFGNAFAGRGLSLNDAIRALNPLFEDLEPVAKILNQRETQLKRFFPALAAVARIVAPVADQQAELFANAAIAFAAISSDPQALQDAITEGVPTLETGIEVLPEQQEFLADFAELSRLLRPGVAELVPTLPLLNEAVTTGTPVLVRTPPVSEDLGRVFTQLERLVEQPSTDIALKRLEGTFDVAEPLAEFVVPAQTVCNYWNYWFTFTPNAFTDFDGVGWNLRQSLIEFPIGPVQVAVGATPETSIPITVPGLVQTSMQGYSGFQGNGRDFSFTDPEGGIFKPFEHPIAHGPAFSPAGQAGTNADCQIGQIGYLLGQELLPGQSPSNPADGVSDIPGSRGPTTAFFLQDGTRLLRDTRVPSRAPETWGK